MMDNHLPDLPTVPMPAAKPPRKRRKSWLVLSLAAGGVFLLCLGIGIAGALFGPFSSQNGHAQKTTGTQTALQSTQTANGSTPATQGTQAGPTSTSTAVPGATPETGQASVTHGRPHLGGPFSDFVGKYGTPTDQGDTNSQNFWVGADQTIDINVLRNTQGVVAQLDVLGPSSWNAQQAENYCIQFLPNNVVQFDATSNQIKYHSSAGVVVLTLQPQSCLLAFARS